MRTYFTLYSAMGNNYYIKDHLNRGANGISSTGSITCLNELQPLWPYFHLNLALLLVVIVSRKETVANC